MDIEAARRRALRLSVNERAARIQGVAESLVGYFSEKNSINGVSLVSNARVRQYDDLLARIEYETAQLLKEGKELRGIVAEEISPQKALC